MEQQYYEIASNFSPVFNIALALLKGRGCEEICYTISSAKISVVNTEYDNWNGGTYGYTVYISLSVKQPEQMYFGLPRHDGLAHFSKVNPSKLKYLYKYAGDMELTFGEFMFDFMLDMENDSEKLTSFFK